MEKDLIVRAGEIPDPQTGALLSNTEVLGNMFIFMFAGHEANANTLVFLILLLACRPGVQKSLQQDISSILGHKPASQWSVETDLPLLSEIYVGAVINETLRLFTILPFIPKAVGKIPQPISIVDRTCVIPAKLSSLSIPARLTETPSIGRSPGMKVQVMGGPPSPTSIQHSGFAKSNPTKANFSARDRVRLYLFPRAAVAVWGAVLLW